MIRITQRHDHHLPRIRFFSLVVAVAGLFAIGGAAAVTFADVRLIVINVIREAQLYSWRRPVIKNAKQLVNQEYS